MWTVIVINFFAVFFAFLAKYKIFEDGLKISFIIIFFFLALRYNFGNDYKSYLNGFLEINGYEEINVFDSRFYFEPGWIVLNNLFEPLGFFLLIAFLAAFNCFLYYYFIRKYVPVKYSWLAVFLYVFNPDIMLIHSSAIRQSVAVGLFIVSLEYLHKKDFLRFSLVIWFASLFHTSALILLPLFLINIKVWRINQVMNLAIITLFISLFFLGAMLQPIINEFLNAHLEKYGRYEGTAQIGTGIGIVLNLLLLIFTLQYEKFQNQERSVLFKIAILGFLIIPLSLLLPMVTRIGMYFQITTIVVYPTVLLYLTRTYMKVAFISLLIFLNLYSFYVFFSSEVYGAHFSAYKTIFSAPQIY